MRKDLHWQIPFVSLDGIHYRIDIYEDNYPGDPVQVLAGPTPFVTNEDASDDFFAPVRSQTGTLQICTKLPSGGMITLEDILPQKNISKPLFLYNEDSNEIEWQGFISCEAYSQNYIGTPQILDIPVISVLEAMRSIELGNYYLSQSGSDNIGDLLRAITDQIVDDTTVQVGTEVSESSDDILTKYIFTTRFFQYEKNEASGNIVYINTSTSLYDVMVDICSFMGWCLREVGATFYFERIGTDELGLTAVNMSSLQWRGTGHQRTIMQGSKQVSVEAKLDNFDVAFEMPTCPTTGLVEKTHYNIGTYWYYDKCTLATVGMFDSEDVTKCFLCRFYGILNDSVYPWNVVLQDIGFSNAIYLTGKKYDDNDTNYNKLCTISSIIDFSVICGAQGTLEETGYLILKIKEASSEQVSATTGYVRCGFKFLGYYYFNSYLPHWVTNPLSTFKVPLTNGSGEVRIEIPKMAAYYTMQTTPLELYIYDDFDVNARTSAIISDISLDFETAYKKDTQNADMNRYVQKLNESRDAVSISLNLASSFGNPNKFSHVYGVKTYRYGPDEIDYIEPITTLLYTKRDNTTEARRPEVDLLNRLAAYYGAARQRLELEVAHPTAAPLPLLKLNGINDGKVYLPLSESRDWQTNVCKLTCFEAPEEPSES